MWLLMCSGCMGNFSSLKSLQVHQNKVRKASQDRAAAGCRRYAPPSSVEAREGSPPSPQRWWPRFWQASKDVLALACRAGLAGWRAGDAVHQHVQYGLVWPAQPRVAALISLSPSRRDGTEAARKVPLIDNLVYVERDVWAENRRLVPRRLDLVACLWLIGR